MDTPDTTRNEDGTPRRYHHNPWIGMQLDENGAWVAYSVLEQQQDRAAVAYAKLLERAEQAEALAEEGLTAAYMLGSADAKDQCRTENSKLREALRFYADPKNWKPSRYQLWSWSGSKISEVAWDHGDKARAAMGEES